MLADETAAEAMGARARQWAARFTWDRMADQVLAVLLAEEGRLGKLPSNRRTSTDLATVVRVPADLLPFGRPLEFRDTDECMMGDADLVVLLRNTDTDTAKVALHRVGLTAAVVIDERVRVSVARPIDLVSPAVSASPAAVAATPVLARPEELHPDSQAG